MSTLFLKKKTHSSTKSYNNTVVFVCVIIILSGISSNEIWSLFSKWIYTSLYLSRPWKHQLQRLVVRIIRKQTKWQTKMVQEAEAENRKYGNVGCIVQKPDTLCGKILNMLMQNNNSSALSPNVCQWKWQVTLISVLSKGMLCSKCRLDMTTRLNLVKRFDATRHQKHIFSAADNLFRQFLRFP